MNIELFGNIVSNPGFRFAPALVQKADRSRHRDHVRQTVRSLCGFLQSSSGPTMLTPRPAVRLSWLTIGGLFSSDHWIFLDLAHPRRIANSEINRSEFLPSSPDLGSLSGWCREFQNSVRSIQVGSLPDLCPPALSSVFPAWLMAASTNLGRCGTLAPAAVPSKGGFLDPAARFGPSRLDRVRRVWHRLRFCGPSTRAEKPKIRNRSGHEPRLRGSQNR